MFSSDGGGVSFTFTPATPSASEERGEQSVSVEDASFLRATEGQLTGAEMLFFGFLFSFSGSRFNKLNLTLNSE